MMEDFHKNKGENKMGEKGTLMYIDSSGEEVRNPVELTFTTTWNSFSNMKQKNISDFKPERVIFSDNVTTVFWSDGSKSQVICGENDVFDMEHGVAMAIAHKMFGSKNQFKKFITRKGYVAPDKETREKKEEARKEKNRIKQSKKNQGTISGQVTTLPGSIANLSVNITDK